MAVDQAWRQVSAGKVDRLQGLVIAKADNTFVIDGDVCLINLAAEHVDELRVLEQQLGWFLAASDAQLMLKLPHERTCSAVTCSVASTGFVAPTRPAIAFEMASQVAGDAIGTSPPRAPKAATASRLASLTEIAR